ncbi:MAG TPA: hypothetical protein VJ717_18450 [Gemmatimonadaceae bacterium]|nr:hypothetical protein [Gemmatimonadaceae bacterium]
MAQQPRVLDVYHATGMATIIGPGGKSSATVRSNGWLALGAVGVLFLVVGLTDLVLAWTPPRFGNADWEFGTVTAMFNNLPVPSMGVGLALAATSALESVRGQRVVGGVALLLVIWSLVGAVFFALTLPLALGAINEPGPRQALMTSTVKTGVQIVVYTVFYVWAVRFAWVRAR